MLQQNDKIDQLKAHLEGFLAKLDTLDPEKTSISDIDQLIQFIEKMEQDLQ
ncbi:SE1561 family protein [Aquibacillus kalidii]|uniref:SE1561 family protein n=1 Tax=Aquibacillus kalidii TaxID=2762597 RepID=UPI001645A25F|nr:SE1561 family protein [Aquibacillus kalidii]